MERQLENLSAYEVLEKRKITDLNSDGYVLRHRKTGAAVTLLLNDDENKVFYIGFRTPPKDSTGVAHMMSSCFFRSKGIFNGAAVAASV